jgi:hypothetical protein
VSATNWNAEHQIDDLGIPLGKLSNGGYKLAPTYTIYKVGGNTYAQDADGAVAYSGANSATVIQSCINAMPNGGQIFIKVGVYSITANITPANYIVICGESVCNSGIYTVGTVLQQVGALNAIFYNAGATVRGFEINHLSLMGSWGSATGSGIVGIFDELKVTDCYIAYFPQYGGRLSGNVNWISRCSFGASKLACLRLANAAPDWWGFNDSWVTDSIFSGYYGGVAYCVGIEAGLSMCRIVNNHFCWNTTAINATSCNVLQILGNEMETFSGRGIYSYGSDNVVICDNTISGNGVNPTEGIYIHWYEAANRYHTVCGNKIDGTNYPFRADYVNHVTVAHNIFRNGVTANALLATNGVDFKMEGNDGYNPHGNIATPWPNGAGNLSDSAAALDNPVSDALYSVSESPKLIILTNCGGISAVQIDGNTLTGITTHDPQIYQLNPGQTIHVVWATTTPHGEVYAQ